jgi:hypothetical protein
MNAEVGTRKSEGSEEKETRELVRMIQMFLENYRQCSNNTGTQEIVRRASRRVEECLNDCLEKVALDFTALEAGVFDCHCCGVNHDLDRDLEEFRARGEVSAVLLMRKFRYSFVHAALAIEQLQARGFVELAGPTLRLVDWKAVPA